MTLDMSIRDRTRGNCFANHVALLYYFTMSTRALSVFISASGDSRFYSVHVGKFNNILSNRFQFIDNKEEGDARMKLIQLIVWVFKRTQIKTLVSYSGRFV